jgi:hypothetical protein
MQNQFNLYLTHLQNGNTDATFYHASLDDLLKWIKKEPEKDNLFTQIDLAKNQGLYKLEQKLLHQTELLEDERALNQTIIQYIIKRLEEENSQIEQEPKVEYKFFVFVPAGLDPKKYEEIERAQALREGKEYIPTDHTIAGPQCEIDEDADKSYDIVEELSYTSKDGTYRVPPGVYSHEQINWMKLHKNDIPPEHDDPILEAYNTSLTDYDEEALIKQIEGRG